MAKTPTKTSAIDKAAPTPAPAPAPWTQPATEGAGAMPTAQVDPAPVEPTPAELAAEPFAQPNETPAELAQDEPVEAVEPEPALNAPEPEEVPPVEEKLTLDEDDTSGDGDEPTGEDGRPDGFIPGDQTAAGALTPPGGQHPGAPRGLLPGESPNLLDPYNVNGSQRNQELIAAGHGIANPAIGEEDPNVTAAQEDAKDA